MFFAVVYPHARRRWKHALELRACAARRKLLQAWRLAALQDLRARLRTQGRAAEVPLPA